MADHAKNIRVEEGLLLAEYDRLLDICIEKCIGFEGEKPQLKTKEARKKYFLILYNKLTSGPARPFFVKNIAGICQSLSSHDAKKALITIDQKLITRIGFISEVVICIQYYHNQILDEKSGVDKPRKIVSNWKEADQLKKALYCYVESEIPELIRKKIIATLNRCFLAVDFGQYLEKKTSTFQFMTANKGRNVCINEIFNPFVKKLASESRAIKPNFSDHAFLKDPKNNLIKDNIIQQIRHFCVKEHHESDSENCFNIHLNSLKRDLIHQIPSEEINFILSEYLSNYSHSRGFLILYFQRVYLTCATLYVAFTELVADLYGLEESHKRNLKRFSVQFGIMRQVVNDNTDCIPSWFNPGTKTKKPTDTFKDLRNNNITLPLFLLICDGRKNKTKRMLRINPKAISPAFCDNRAFRELMDTNTWDSSVEFCQKLSRNAITHLACFRNTENKKALRYLCSIAFYNKFYHTIAACKDHSPALFKVTPSLAKKPFAFSYLPAFSRRFFSDLLDFYPRNA